jgi:hypothetical protein
MHVDDQAESSWVSYRWPASGWCQIQPGHFLGNIAAPLQSRIVPAGRKRKKEGYRVIWTAIPFADQMGIKSFSKEIKSKGPPACISIGVGASPFLLVRYVETNASWHL